MYYNIISVQNKNKKNISYEHSIFFRSILLQSSARNNDLALLIGYLLFRRDWESQTFVNSRSTEFTQFTNEQNGKKLSCNC